MPEPISQDAPASAPSPTRRRFYLGAIYSLWTAITAALAAPAVLYLLFPPKQRREAEWVTAADLSKLTTGIPEEVSFERNRVDGWKVTAQKTTAWVVKQSGSKAVAFAPQCTHLGCAYHWDEHSRNFLCPCHNSVFAIDGKVLSGPAPRPLDRYAVKIDGPKVVIGPLEPHA
jgi:quinol---cytochrome c reductase iron-sulfur subunit, bacillus type